MARFLASAFSAVSLSALALTTAECSWAQSLDSYGVLAGSTVTNTGPSVITGHVGVSPGTSITGFDVPGGPGIVNAPYVIHNNDADAGLVQSELTTAYNALALRPTTVNLTGQDLGGLVLTPGVYAFDSSAQLTGTLTLDGLGNPNAVFVFNIDSTLTTASGSDVNLINGAQGGNVFFRVGSSATLGTTTAFEGKILALTDITLNNAASINCGAALARNGAVTLDTNTISVCTVIAATFSDVLGSSGRDNQQAVADAIDDFVANGGTLPAQFQDLLDFLSPAELAAAFTQLSGEAASGVAPTGIQAMNSLLSLVYNMGFDEEDSSEPGTVSVKGLVIPQHADVASEAEDFASFANQDMPRFWAAVYGSQNMTDGNGSDGSHDRSARSYGIAVGLDKRISPDTTAGFGVAGGGTDFDLSNSMGGGESDMVQAVTYIKTRFNSAYLSGALAYGWHDVSTDRYVTVAGLDHLTADFSAHNAAAQVEAGYQFGWFTPYAALRGQAFYTPSYSERAASGSAMFALDYEERTMLTARTELGARIYGAIEMDNGATLSARAGGLGTRLLVKLRQRRLVPGAAWNELQGEWR